MPITSRWLPALAAALLTVGTSPAPVQAAGRPASLTGHALVAVPAARGHLVQPVATPGARGGSAPKTMSTADTVATTSFPLIDVYTDASILGLDQRVSPPDTMVAAGPTALLEVVNRSASVWNKSGTLVALADLNHVLPLPTGWVASDPRVLYDAPSGRFFFSSSGSDSTNDGLVVIAVSATSNPGGSFTFWTIAQSANGVLHDQPKIGISDDKLIVTWDDFVPGGTYVGSEIWVLQKSTLLAGQSTPMVAFGPTVGPLSAVPAQALTAGTTAYVITNGGTYANVASITGTPAAQNVAMVQSTVAIPTTPMPPAATQPNGNPLLTGDTRFLSAVWANGKLWASGNEGCATAPSTTQRACARVVEVTTNGSPRLVVSLDAGSSAGDVFYPAVVVTSARNVYVAVSVSSSTTYPSAAVIEFAGGTAPGSFIVFQNGLANYPGTAWGDYSAISIDPSSGQVWAAAEYVDAGTAGAYWGTATGLFPA